MHPLRAQKFTFYHPHRSIVIVSYQNQTETKKKKKTDKTHNYSFFLYNLYSSKYTIPQWSEANFADDG